MQMKYFIFNSFSFVRLTNTVQVITLDPSSPLGYEKKYAALLGMGHNDDAIAAFETMLLKMSESSDLEIRGRGYHIIPMFFH